MDTNRMLLKGCLKIWISLSFVLMGTKGSRPRFDTSTDMGMVLVPADAEVDSVIFRLRATDQDVDFPLVFDITSTISPVVRIENLPCTLYNKVCQANVILTRRLTAGRLHDFAVRVRDSKGDSNSMQATISVTNATTPRDTIFPHIPTLIMVPEDTKPGKELDYILVKSNPWSGKPVYIELWQPKELFTIRQRLISGHTRGTIILTGELDFETQSMYTLTIYATDPYTEPRKDTRNIAGLHLIVIVQDVQDVPPIFTLAPPLTKINNTVQLGDVILRVHAEDGDKGVPREISYGLVSEGNPFTPFFNITETTGEIILARPLEELTQITHVGAPIVLSIVAEEIRRSTDEPPTQATVVKVGLLLGEPGNSPPYFENDNYVTWMDENAEPGTSIIFEEPYITKVRDEDVGKAGVFTLQLENNNGTFEISPSVAERNANFILTIRDNFLIDYEVYKSLRFKIVAQEVGPATNLSASVPVTIFLRDKNDNPPEFEEASYEVTLSENVTAGTRITQVHATDKDTGFFGKIQYTRIIGPGSEAFAIHPETGVITVSMDTLSLDREITPQLQLIVEACDEDGRGLKGTVPFIVNLLDANDNAPIFEKDTYEFMLNIDLTNFTIPAVIKAFDADAEPPNNQVRYEIIHGNYDNKFILNDTTGELFLREPITKIRSTRHNAYQRFATKLRKTIVSTSESPQKISSSTPKSFDLSTIFSVLSDKTIKDDTASIKRRKRENKDVLFTLTARAYDLGVPHLSGTTQVKILQSPQAGVRTLMFLVPGEHPDRIKTAQTLATITGGRVTVMEIRPYIPGNLPNGIKDIPISGTEKKSIVVAKVEYTGFESSLVDIEKIRAALAANGVGVISGDMSPNGNTEINPPVTNRTIIIQNNTSTSTNVGTSGEKPPTVVSSETNVNKTTIVTTNREEVIVYKAENKLLFWLLIILGLLVLAAIIILIVCCICPGCPFYMAPRKRRVRSSDTFTARVDGRPKKHMYRKYPQTDEKKQAWSADQTRDNWQFNRRNIRNYGIASLPGDVACDDRYREFPRKAHSLRLQDATESIHITETRKRGQDRLYVEDIEGFRVKGYDVPDMDSLRQNEIERGSDMTREAYVRDIREKDPQMFRDQQFYRSGNAEVMRLVTRGAAEGNITYRQPEIIIDQVHKVDGKDILLRRFIEDQNLRVNQDYHGSMQDLEKQSMESHKRQKEVSMQQQQSEIILIPEQLEEAHRQHIEELGPDVQRLIIDHRMYDKSIRSDMKESQDAATGATLIIQGPIPKAPELLKEQNIPKYPVNVQHYSIHDLELARQNALLTRLLLEKDRGVNAAMMDTGSYLETQSLPGQVAAGTQTNQSIATQTEQQSRSRSDNEESEEDARLRRKMRSKKKYDGEAKRARTLWMRSPIREEDREYSEKDTTFIKKKIKDIKDVRKSNIESEVLKEISDSLDETGDRETPVENRESFGDSSNSRDESRDEIPQRDDSSSIEMSKDEYTRAHGRRVDDRNETRKKEKEVTGKEEAQGVKKSSFKILEREISSLSKKLSKLTGKKIPNKYNSFHNVKISKDSYDNEINITSPDTNLEDEKKLKKVDTVRSKRSTSMQRVTKLAARHLKMPDRISDKNRKQPKLKSAKNLLVSTASSELEEIDRVKTQVTTKGSEGETSKSSVRKVTKTRLNRQTAIKEKDASSIEKKKDTLVRQSKKLDDKIKKPEHKLKHSKQDRNKMKEAAEMAKNLIKKDYSKEPDKEIKKWKTKPVRKQENSSTDESQTSKDLRDSDSRIFSNKTSITSPTETLESPKPEEIKEKMIDVQSIILNDERKSLITQESIDSSSTENQSFQMEENITLLEADQPSLITSELLIDLETKEKLSAKDEVSTSEKDKKKLEELQKGEFTFETLSTSFSESSIGKHEKNIEESTIPVASTMETMNQNIENNLEEIKHQATELVQKHEDTIKEKINAIKNKIVTCVNEKDTEIINSPRMTFEEEEKIKELKMKVVEAFESAGQKELAMSDVPTVKISGVDVLDDTDEHKDKSKNDGSEDFNTEIKVEALPAVLQTCTISNPLGITDISIKSVASKNNSSKLLAITNSNEQIEEKYDETYEDLPKVAISSEEQKIEIDKHVDIQQQEQSHSIKNSLNITMDDKKVQKDIKEDNNKQTNINLDKNMEFSVPEDKEENSEQVKKATPIAELIADRENTLLVKISDESVKENEKKHKFDVTIESTSPVSQTSSLSPKQLIISRETSFLSSPKKIVDEPPVLSQEKLDLVDEAESKLEIHISEDQSDLSDKKIELFIDKPESYESNLIHNVPITPDSSLIEKFEDHSFADTVDTLDDESDVSSESSTQTAFIARPYGTPRHRRLVRMDRVSPNESEMSSEKQTDDVKADETSKLTTTKKSESSDDLKTDGTREVNGTSMKKEDSADSSEVDRKLEPEKISEIENSHAQTFHNIVSTESESATVQIEDSKTSQQETKTSVSNIDGSQKVQESKDNVESIAKHELVDVDDSTSLTDPSGSVNNLHGNKTKSGEQKIIDSTELLSIIQSKDSLKHFDDSSKISKSRDSSREKFPQNQDVFKDKPTVANEKIRQNPLGKKDSIKEKRQNQVLNDQVNLSKKIVGKTRLSKVSDSESEQSKEKIIFDRKKSRKRLDHEKIVPEKSKDGRSIKQKTKKQPFNKDQKVDLHSEDLKKEIKRIEGKSSKTNEIKLSLCDTKDKTELVLSESPQEKKVDTKSTLSVNADMKEIEPLVSDMESKRADKEICIEVEGAHTKVDRTRKTSRKTEKMIIVEINSFKNRENKIEKIKEETTTESYISNAIVEGPTLQDQLTTTEKFQSTSSLVSHDEKNKTLHDQSPGLQKIIRHYKEEPHEAQPRYMEWYKQNKEEIERKRQEKKENEEDEQPPKWLRKSTRQRWLKMTPEDRKIFELKTPEVTIQRRKRIKPLVNVESEQLKAIVRQGRKLRKAEGGNGDPSIEIYIPDKPPPSLPSQSQVKHYRTQHSEYKYEKLPPPFYLHPPPVPHSTPQASPRSFETPPESSSTELTQEQMTSPAIVPFQGVSRLRHQQLLEKKSVFDIAYSEAAPPHLRADSTTPPS